MARKGSNSKLTTTTTSTESSSSSTAAAAGTTTGTNYRLPTITTTSTPTVSVNPLSPPNGSNRLTIGRTSSLSPTASSLLLSSIRITKQKQQQRKNRKTTILSFIQFVCFLLLLLVLIVQYTTVLHWNHSSYNPSTSIKDDVNIMLSIFTNNNQQPYNNTSSLKGNSNTNNNNVNNNINVNVNNQQSKLNNNNNIDNVKNNSLLSSNTISNCAILFWGLPRAFDTIVLPSIIENIIIPNQKYRCDYYVHYYDTSSEAAGRSGSGGMINTLAIRMLQSVIEQYHNTSTNDNNNNNNVLHKPIIQFVSNTEKEFWDMYTPLIEKIRTTKDPKGRYYYYPWKAVTYVHPTTTDNIIKMWHTIQSVWNLMEHYSRNISSLSTTITTTTYKQVAMLRSDILYVTPIDIYNDPTSNGEKGTTVDTSQGTAVAVIPNFGKHPVSDRIIYGPYKAVQIWATQRFNHLEEHVKYIYDNDRGWGLHHERFMNYTIYPLIRQQVKVPVVYHPTMCFLRARSDESIWVSDCEGPRSVSDPSIMQQWNGSIFNLRKHIERILGRKCSKITKPRVNVKSLMCSSKNPPKTK